MRLPRHRVVRGVAARDVARLLRPWRAPPGFFRRDFSHAGMLFESDRMTVMSE